MTIIEGMIIQKSIWTILRIPIKNVRIPYAESMKQKNRLLSIVPRSLDSLLMIIPDGVVSK